MPVTPPPILLIASRHDPVAQDFAGSAGAVLLMTAADLSSGGWSYRPGAGGDSSLRVGGVDWTVAELGGVVTRLPWITEAELPHIHAEDQAYVAAEMNALLVAWLDELPCPVLNRPSPACLSGPAWRPEHWLRLALRLGLPADSGPRIGTAEPASIHVIGAEVVGAADAAQADGCRRLAAAAGLEYLRVGWVGEGAEARWVSADPLPDLAQPEVAERILAWFGRSGPQP